MNMEEKLELKHVKNYLGTNVLVRTRWNGKKLNKPKKLKGIDIDLLENSNGFELFMLLHPLDRLTELGNENILINEHSINKLLEEKYGLEYGFFTFYKGKIEIELEADPMLQYDQTKSFDFEVLQTIHDELFKAHYDVFGLIEKGLALPIDPK